MNSALSARVSASVSTISGTTPIYQTINGVVWMNGTQLSASANATLSTRIDAIAAIQANATMTSGNHSAERLDE